MPRSDYLRRSIPWFYDLRVGCVQARWDHINRDYSLLTRLQALAIDGHFTIEQTARSQNDLFLNFNGTAGVWRRTCIQDAGGWSRDTLTEDLDLSYRAQLKGWHIAYIHDLSVPAELPAQITALKQQQSRWAKGSMQTTRKLLIPLIKSPFPLRNKIEGILHLTHYIVHPLILGALLLSLPMSFSYSPLMKLIPLLMLAAVGPPMLYLTASVPGGPDFFGRLKLLPGLVLIGIGLSLSNSQAVLSGLLLRKKGTFSRTPKFALQQREDRWEHSLYALRQDTWMWVEFGLVIFTCIVLSIALVNRLWGFIPWLVIYLGSFLYVGGVALVQNYIQRRGPGPSWKKEPSLRKKQGLITHPPD
jgi:cellulose synthase/poly-beta-1,6-N-acetylglucosamine synthase-like glycosyltransferase